MLKESKKINTANLTLYEDEFLEEKKEKIDLLQIAVFRLSQEWYAVELQKIKEIVKLSKITYLPLSPKHIAGIINLRGKIISVTDLKKLFSLSAENFTESSRIVVVEHQKMETGLLVDEVTEVISIPKDKIDPPINTISSGIKDFIKGEIKVSNNFVVLLNTDFIFEGSNKRE